MTLPGCTVTGSGAQVARQHSILRDGNRVKSVVNGVTTYYVGINLRPTMYH